jgi:hypothetical protein
MTFKKALLRGILGIPIGIFIMSLIALIISLCIGKLSFVSPSFLGSHSELESYTVQFILCSIVGFVCAASSAFFQIEKWSITKQTLMHFLALTIVYIPTAIYLGWVKFRLLDIVFYVLIFVAIYVVIWIIQYSAMKSKVKKLNGKITKKAL